MVNLTPRQLEVLAFIINEGLLIPPPQRKISEHFQVSLRATQKTLAALQRKGFLPEPKKVLASR